MEELIIQKLTADINRMEHGRDDFMNWAEFVRFRQLEKSVYLIKIQKQHMKMDLWRLLTVSTMEICRLILKMA